MTLSGRCYISVISISAGALTLGLNAPAHAQQVVNLEAITVESAGLAPAPAPEVGSAYTVITSEELLQRQIAHAADALRVLPGVNVSQTGGAGGYSQIRVRGSEANHAKIIVDGVEVNSLDSGDFDFSTLLASDIERIELLRGPQSGVYGSNALAGVINVITKKGSGEPSVTASVEGGSFNTRAVTANASGGSEKAYLSFTAADRQSDGFPLAPGGTIDNGSEQKTFFARGGMALSEYFRLDGMARYQYNRASYDEDQNGDGIVDDTRGSYNERKQTLGRISATLDLFDKRWSQKAFADYLGDDYNNMSALYGASGNKGERARYGYESTYRFDTPEIGARHTLVGLVERKDESFDSTIGFQPESRSQNGLAAEYRGEFYDRLSLTGNIRQDYNSAFADAFTYRAAAAYAVPGWGTRFHGSYGKGVTDPTFLEQFGTIYSFPGFIGNPNVTPEQSIGWDAGVEQKFFGGRMLLDVTYFNANLTDEIYNTYAVVGGKTFMTVANAPGESSRQGLETQITLRPADGWSIIGSYTYTNAVDPQNIEELRRPKHGAGVNVAYTFAEGRATVNVGASYNGSMKDNRYIWAPPYVERMTVGNYWLVNLAGSYKLDERFTLFGRIENLLDQKYQEVYGYASAPVAAYGGIKVSLNSATAQIEPTK